MAEYIERAVALRVTHIMRPEDEDLKSAISNIPTADVAPVVHGRWSDAGFGELPKHAPYGWACSACGGISFNNEYIYCPNCGAKMDGGADHEAD